MKYVLEIRPAAMADIDQAAAWYEAQRNGLGVRFVRTVRKRIDELPSHPLMYPLRNRRRNARWFYASPFPYRVCYRISGDLVTVFA